MYWENRVLWDVLGEKVAEGCIGRRGCRGMYWKSRVLRDVLGEQGADGCIGRTGC